MLCRWGGGGGSGIYFICFVGETVIGWGWTVSELDCGCEVYYDCCSQVLVGNCEVVVACQDGWSAIRVCPTRLPNHARGLEERKLTVPLCGRAVDHHKPHSETNKSFAY